MRGSPLLRTLLVVLVLSLTAYPIWKLTNKAATVVPAANATPATMKRVRVELTFAHAPGEFQLMHLGKLIWETKTPGATAAKDFEMEFPKEGVDLEIKAVWAAGTPATAVRVSLIPSGGAALEKTAWGTGSMDEVLTFSAL